MKDFVVTLPTGWYRDENGLLRTSDGGYIPDGVYKDENGIVFMYEGIFEVYGFDKGRPATVDFGSKGLNQRQSD
ncbi:hypothetical protein AALA21_01075 [Eggerthellaceae bacterium 3-80]|nr:hypothetical protein D7W09_01230 [bacterium D16-34]